MTRIKKAVFPVAGLGTRFLPVTKSVPKEMLPILNRPLIEYALEEAFESGVEQVLFVNGRGKSSIEDYFDRHVEVESTLAERHKSEALQSIRRALREGGSYAFVRQVDPKGLGHAVLCAQHWIKGESFAVLLPDDFIQAKPGCLKQMAEAYDVQKGNLVALMDVPASDVSSYGVLDPLDPHGKGPLVQAKGVVEKPSADKAPSSLAVIGRYILHPDIFSVLETQTVGHGGEIQLTDALLTMCGSHGLWGLQFQGNRFDCGHVAGMVSAQVAQAAEDPETWDRVAFYLKQVGIDMGKNTKQ